MKEYGIFNDEGCIEAGMYTLSQALTAKEYYIQQGDTDIFVEEICSDHEEQPAKTCEECY